MSFDWHKVIKPTGDPPPLAEVSRFEESIGLDLPCDYRDFLLKFNGGEVITEHDIGLAETPFVLGVESFWSLTAPSPGLGISEGRRMQTAQKWCLRQSIGIADDGGTGHYYLILAGEKAGGVYFVWLDERSIRSEEDWETWEVRIPEEMIEVSPDFDSLGELILSNAQTRRQ
jgi:hypothetical protein